MESHQSLAPAPNRDQPKPFGSTHSSGYLCAGGSKPLTPLLSGISGDNQPWSRRGNGSGHRSKVTYCFLARRPTRHIVKIRTVKVLCPSSRKIRRRRPAIAASHVQANPRPCPLESSFTMARYSPASPAMKPYTKPY